MPADIDARPIQEYTTGELMAELGQRYDQMVFAASKNGNQPDGLQITTKGNGVAVLHLQNILDQFLRMKLSEGNQCAG